MVAIFLTKDEAQKYSDKVFNWLMQNCPNINGICWQQPQKHPKEEKYYIEVPQEYEKIFYKDCDKIKIVCQAEFAKAISTPNKLPDDWKEVEAVIK